MDRTLPQARAGTHVSFHVKHIFKIAEQDRAKLMADTSHSVFKNPAKRISPSGQGP